MVSDELPAEASGFGAEVAGGFAAGARVAGYRLEGQIGPGGMAVVFRAPVTAGRSRPRRASAGVSP